MSDDNRGRKKSKIYMYDYYDSELEATNAIVNNGDNLESKNIYSKRIKNDDSIGAPKKDGSNSKIVYYIKNKYNKKKVLDND